MTHHSRAHHRKGAHAGTVITRRSDASTRLCANTLRIKIARASRGLFYECGFHATSVERIAAMARTHKMTVYRLFASKEQLALWYIDEIAAETDARWLELKDRNPEKPEAQLRAFFADSVCQVSKAGYRGDPLLKLAAEFGDESDLVSIYADTAWDAAQLPLQSTIKALYAPPEVESTLLLLRLAAVCPGQTHAQRRLGAAKFTEAIENALSLCEKRHHPSK